MQYEIRKIEWKHWVYSRNNTMTGCCNYLCICRLSKASFVGALPTTTIKLDLYIIVQS